MTLKFEILDKNICETRLRVQLPIPKGRYNPKNDSQRAFPLKEVDLPENNIQLIEEASKRIEAIHRVIDFLDVENCPRYTGEVNKTFCNIYAYDVAYCLGAYLPRVWWDINSINRILNGKKIDVKYGETVFEMNSNALADWFELFGEYFNWSRVAGEQELTVETRKGRIGIIVAKRNDLSKPGHITVALPPPYKLIRNEPKDTILQSQAGRLNKKYFKDNWWSSENFSNVGFWIYG